MKKSLVFSGIFFMLTFLHAYTLDWTDYQNVEVSSKANNNNANKYQTTSTLILENVDASGVDIQIEVETTHTPEDFDKNNPNHLGVNNTKFTGAAEAEDESGRHSLYLLLNNYDAGDEMRISVSFLESGTKKALEVSGVSFELFDVDAQLDGGTVEVADRIYGIEARSISGDSLSASVTLENSKYTKYNNGKGNLVGKKEVLNSHDHSSEDAAGTYSNYANAEVSFAENELTEYEFYYSASKKSTQLNETGIGLYDITFDVVGAPKVPEVGVFHALILVAALAYVYKRRKS